MAITNHERVGKAMELLKGGLGPFVEREFKSTYKDRAAAEVQRFLGDDRLNAKKSIADMGRGGAAQAHVGILERRVPPDARARPSAAWSASCATIATGGRTRRPSPATTPIVRSTRPAAC